MNEQNTTSYFLFSYSDDLSDSLPTISPSPSLLPASPSTSSPTPTLVVTSIVSKAVGSIRAVWASCGRTSAIILGSLWISSEKFPQFSARRALPQEAHKIRVDLILFTMKGWAACRTYNNRSYPSNRFHSNIKCHGDRYWRNIYHSIGHLFQRSWCVLSVVVLWFSDVWMCVVVDYSGRGCVWF